MSGIGAPTVWSCQSSKSPPSNRHRLRTVLLAAAFATPSVALGLRGLPRVETEAVATYDESKVEVMGSVAARKEIGPKTAENNDLGAAAATQMLATRGRPCPSSEGPKGKRGRKPQYESAEERKKAMALRAK